MLTMVKCVHATSERDSILSEFCLFFGRIKDAIICFRDSLAFRKNRKLSLVYSSFSMILLWLAVQKLAAQWKCKEVAGFFYIRVICHLIKTLSPSSCAVLFFFLFSCVLENFLIYQTYVLVILVTTTMKWFFDTMLM